MVKIHIFRLPMNSTYVSISEGLRDKIYNYIVDDGGIGKYSKLMKIDKSYFYRLKYGKNCSLSFLFSIYNYLRLNLLEVEKNILSIVSGKNNSVGINNPKLPFVFDNKYGGILLGAIMGDGSRTKIGGLIYNNKNKKLIKKVLESSKKIFGDVRYKIYFKKDGTIQLNLPKITGDVVGLLGIERSYKTISDCYIDLSNFSNDMTKYFIKQFYNDEGNVRITDRRLQVKQSRQVNTDEKSSIRENIEKYAPRILLQLKYKLSEFRINSTISLECIRKHEDKVVGDFSLNIYGKENLENFQKDIGFDIKYKKRLLSDIIKNYKFPSAPRNKRLLFAFEKAKETQKKYGYIDKILLAKESKRSIKTATYFLTDMKKKGWIKILEKPRKSNGVPLPYRYYVGENLN
jgi:hypothetical protein